MDENKPEEEVVLDEETTEEEETEEVVESDEAESEAEVVEEEVDWKERALKAERAIENAKKKSKRAQKTVTRETPKEDLPSNSLSRDDVAEMLYIKEGYSEEAIDELKAIARGKGISMPEAEKTPVFQAYKREADAKAKRQEAQLKASGGSGAGRKKKDFSDKLTPEEHKALWDKRFK